MTSSPYSRFSGFANGRAAPVSPDRQQGPLSPPPSQQQAPQYNQAAAKQFGSSQAGGDYSVYGRQSGYSQGGYKNYAQPVGQTIPYQQPAARPPQMTPEEIRAKYPNLERMPTVVDGPPSDPRRGSFTPDSPTWNDPRNAKARERYNKLLDEYTQYQAPQQTPIYGGGPGADGQPFYQPGDFGRRVRLAQDPRPVTQPYNNPPPAPQPYYGTPEANFPGFPSGQQSVPSVSTGQWLSQPQVFNLPAMDQGPQFYNQRDAFINNINQSLGQQMMQNFGSAQPMPPQMNYGALWGQAGEMARNGWSNPLAGLFA